jgi:signal transduction histidine kinase
LENIQYLLNVSRNTHNLLENLLLWASNKTKVFEIKPEVIDMNQVLDTALLMVSSQALFKKITIEKTCSGDMAAFADKNMILTVLRNLISNAIKFSKPESHIEILVEENSDILVTSVTDFGTGMEEISLQNLFTESNALKSGRMGEFGTGLGLVLRYEIIQKHKGKIWANSTPGEGSVFYFSLGKGEVLGLAG